MYQKETNKKDTIIIVLCLDEVDIIYTGTPFSVPHHSTTNAITFDAAHIFVSRSPRRTKSSYISWI